MRQEVIITGDGSSTVLNTETDTTYHSRHGAIQESRHVFLQTGLDHYLRSTAKKAVSILEIGFGTGLNALLTALYADEHGISIKYEALEPYPLGKIQLSGINYGQILNAEELFHMLHNAGNINITANFKLDVHHTRLQDFTTHNHYDIIYFDAFAPGAQQELWTAVIFAKLYQMLLPGGLLTSYCSKSIVRKAMQEAGFTISKLPGPHGKREIIRAQRSTD